MKALQLEYPVDEHLKPVKDSDSVSTSMELSTTKLRVKDFEATGTITGFSDDTKLPLSGGTMTGNVDFGDSRLTNLQRIQFSGDSTYIGELIDSDDMSSASATTISTSESIKAYVDAVPNTGCYSKTLIKLMPIDFVSNDDRASAYAVVEDDTADTLGIKAGHSAVELYAFVKIPDGYKATHVQVLASASTSNAVVCKTFNYTTGATTDLETFDFNSNTDITDVTATTTNDFVIKLLPASNVTIIYGATVTMVHT